MAPSRRRTARWILIVAAATLLASGSGPSPQAAMKKKIRYTAVAVEPGLSEQVDAGRRIAMDAAALSQLVLSLTPHLDVRWRPAEKGGPTIFRLTAPATGTATGNRAADAVEAAHRMLSALPREWRRPALSLLDRMRIDLLDEAAGAALLDALGARLAGDPERAASVLKERVAAGAPTILTYLAGASSLEAGDVKGAASILAGVEEARDLPSPLKGMARAAAAAARDATGAAIGSLDGVIGEAPSLSEARAFRARLLLGDCASYDLEIVRSDVRAALLSNPCCASCDLTVAETEAFAGRPLDGIDLLSAQGCELTALDSARERALSLLLAASGNRKDAMEAAGRAEAKDVSALRRGLAPAFMLAGDNAHLEEAYDSESDLRLAPNVSIEQHLYAGLNALWTGRPSAAAFQFERALEHVRAHSPGEPAASPMSQILTALRIRSYLAAGRIDEARRAAAEATELARDRAQGLLEYTIALTAIAGGEEMKALTMIRASGRPSEKIWSYLTQAQVSLGSGRAKDALESVNLALAGIGSQIAVCPGVSTEPYLLEPQARTLLAEGRPAESLRVLDRLFALGSRGLFAPDVIVPAWLVAGQAREAQGDASGARKAYTALLDLWGKGEETPAALKAKERLAALP